jgi:hypothetical protein
MKHIAVKKLILAIGLAVAATTVVNATLAPVQAIPSELVGKWKWGTINPTWFEDKYTGEYKGHGGGVSAYFDFDKNGRFKHYVYIEHNTNGWKTMTFTTMEGKLVMEGDTFRLKVEKGSYKSRSNRVERHNFDRPMTAEEREKSSKNPYRWKKATDPQGREILQVVNGGGEGPITTFQRDK